MDFAKRFGDDVYGVEELVAEHGATFQRAELGISSKPRADHAQYPAHLMSVMTADKKAVFTAAAIMMPEANARAMQLHLNEIGRAVARGADGLGANPAAKS